MAHEALLVMDVQPNIVERMADTGYVAQVQKVVDWAHSHEVPVIFVVVGFREGLPEVSSENQSFAALKSTSAAAMTNPKPAIEPKKGDVVVTKRRVSAFTGSDLEVILRAGEIRHLVLCGIATSGVVLSTVREAADLDYRMTVLSDLCADMDPEVHRVLLEKVFPRQAQVVSADEWMKS